MVLSKKIDYEIMRQKILTREYFLMYVRVAILILAVKGWKISVSLATHPSQARETYQEMVYCSGSILVIKRKTIALLLSEAPSGFFRWLARKHVIIG